MDEVQAQTTMTKNLSETIKRVIQDESDVSAATAPYQVEFPYERDEEAQVTRREFCNFLGLTSAALFVGAAGFAAKATLDARESVSLPVAPIGGAETLAPNSSLNFSYPTAKDSAILVRTADGAYHAYGQKCTHLSCPVYYARDHQRLECPCHEGAFDAVTGSVLYGPPPRALDTIEVEMRDGQLWATGRTAAQPENGG